MLPYPNYYLWTSTSSFIIFFGAILSAIVLLIYILAWSGLNSYFWFCFSQMWNTELLLLLILQKPHSWRQHKYFHISFNKISIFSWCAYFFNYISMTKHFIYFPLLLHQRSFQKLFRVLFSNLFRKKNYALNTKEWSMGKITWRNWGRLAKYRVLLTYFEKRLPPRICEFQLIFALNSVTRWDNCNGFNLGK